MRPQQPGVFAALTGVQAATAASGTGQLLLERWQLVHRPLPPGGLHTQHASPSGASGRSAMDDTAVYKRLVRF